MSSGRKEYGDGETVFENGGIIVGSIFDAVPMGLELSGGEEAVLESEAAVHIGCQFLVVGDHDNGQGK